jgi:hypothetical protein
MMKDTHALIPRGRIEQRIYFLHGEKVMLGTDLARLYQVASRALLQAVNRNHERRSNYAMDYQANNCSIRPR